MLRQLGFGILAVIALTSCSEEHDEATPVPNMTTYQESRAIEKVVADLIAYFDQEFPKIAESLNPPATDDQLGELEKVIGAKLPADFRTLYKIANGQEPVNEPFFHNGFEFMSIEHII